MLFIIENSDSLQVTQYLLQGFIGFSEIQGQILFSALRVSEAGRYQASRLHLALSVYLARAASYHGSCLSSQRLLHPFLFFCVCGSGQVSKLIDQVLGLASLLKTRQFINELFQP